jgi:hypothetical protein
MRLMHRRTRWRLTLAAVAALALIAAGTASATLSVYTYFGPGVAWWNVIHEGPGSYGPRYWNRDYQPTGEGDYQMCLRYHYNDGSYTAWQCNYSVNPFYATDGSGNYLTANPAQAQCKYYYAGGVQSDGLNNVTCQTTTGLP